ncbi:hypothetical protein [Flavobacterium sp. PL002]|uniref:hypothetical protein n=1 Tax=Flavobacterium sp. PL002 TaxID=1897058 RepID=UPI001787E90C|nr:hypothetical protein [Flavobacterium sp. PL002]MBE0391980.1 hypothetical protein [Flavobacterium sp. PL002]
MGVKLNINIDAKGRRFLLDNDENIILVFPCKEDEFSITCLSFSPFGDSNEVEFFDDFFLNATAQDISRFEIIDFNNQQPINYGNVYKFDGISYSYDRQAFSKHVCGLSNESANTKNLTSGITQKINAVNQEESRTISIGSVPQNQTIYFDLPQLVWVFVAKGISSNMILPNDMLTPVKMEYMRKINKPSNSSLIIGNYLEIDLIDLKEATSVLFDSTINAFRFSS